MCATICYMDAFLKMDIFFFVTTLVVILFAILGAVVMWRLSRVLKNIEHISEQVALESDEIRHDFAEVRTRIKQGAGRLRSVLGLFNKTRKRSPKGE